jgi:RNA polymerase sigma factor (sigma-70 family)
MDVPRTPEKALEGFQALLRLAQSGDRAAVDRLFAELEPYMERVAREVAEPGAATESASDIVQEAKVRAWQRLAQFQGGTSDAHTRAMLHAWVGQIVRRVAWNVREARNALRRRAPNRVLVPIGGGGSSSRSQGAGLDPAGSGATPSAAVRKDEEAWLVRLALEKAPDATGREVVRLSFFDGLSVRQAAERLGISYAQAREHYHGTLRRLERELKGKL